MIKPEMIFVDSILETKQDIIELICKTAFQENLINDIENFKHKVFAREAEISTSVGNHVAIPHGKSNAVTEPFIAFVRTATAFKWDENSNDLVKLIFLIGVPDQDANKLHLKYIAEISKKLINDEFRNNLLTLTTKKEISDLLDSINHNINK